MLVIKLRGDGRSYLLNVASEGKYDIWWNDVFHYVLYTRGGPHWQLARVIFCKDGGNNFSSQFVSQSHEIFTIVDFTARSMIAPFTYEFEHASFHVFLFSHNKLKLESQK